MFIVFLYGRRDNMSKIKIAFFDIDGTLIDPEKKRITDNTKKAL